MQLVVVIGLIALLVWMWRVHIYLIRASEMTIDEAKAITSQCLHAALYRTMEIGEPCDLPNCSLLEMLVANRMMNSYSERRENGRRTLYMTVDPRGLALHYAYENFGRNLTWMIESLGYEITDEADED